MAWSDAARKAALEARRRKAHGTVSLEGRPVSRGIYAAALRKYRKNFRSGNVPYGLPKSKMRTVAGRNAAIRRQASGEAIIEQYVRTTPTSLSARAAAISGAGLGTGQYRPRGWRK